MKHRILLSLLFFSSAFLYAQRPYEEYYEDNKTLKAEGFIQDSLATGLWNFYSEKGVKITQCSYKAGLAEGTMLQFHDNGKIELEALFEAGVENGKWLEFYSSGKEKVIGAFRNGKRS